MHSLWRSAGIVALVDANQMYTRCQSSTAASYLRVCKKLKATSEKKKKNKKKNFFEIKAVSRNDVSVKSAEKKICDSMCLEIPYFTDNVTDCVVKFL